MTGVGADHHLGRVGRTLPTLRKGGAETEARNGVVGTIPNRFRRRTQNPGHSPRIAILYQVSLGLGQSLVPEASEENQPLVTTRTDIEREISSSASLDWFNTFFSLEMLNNIERTDAKDKIHVLSSTRCIS